MTNVRNIREVVEAGLCAGCGACAGVQPDVLDMVDVPDRGRRPVLRLATDGVEPSTRDALAVCPGATLGHDRRVTRQDGHLAELGEAWGPVLEVWEGFAADPEIRFAGSSGGAATALAWHCLSSEGMRGVVHISARKDAPHLNESVLSTTRAELLAATGSRYAPASPCERLLDVEQGDGPHVFIGKPCDVAATAKARSTRPRLDRNLGLTIGIFCAGTPSTRGTEQMLRVMGVDDPSSLRELRYRGNGWPGLATAHTADGTATLSYEQSWGEILQKHRQWRCRICADHTGEFADIAVGDPWYRPIPHGEPGRSLVLVRTERGRAILRRAIDAGVLHAERVDACLVPASQPELLRTRGAVWGRIATCRLLGVPVPRYRNMPTLRYWLSELTWRDRLRSTVGTARRLARQRNRERAGLAGRSVPGSPDG